MKDLINDLRKVLNRLDDNTPEWSMLLNVIGDLLEQDEWLLPKWEDLDKPILCVDFDGVISEYKSGWLGAEIIADKPVSGAFEFLNQAILHFNVLIFSSRCNSKSGIKAMIDWFHEHGFEGLEHLHFQPGKPSFALVIDDRAIRFNGMWKDIPSPEDLVDSKPWYYQKEGWRKQ